MSLCPRGHDKAVVGLGPNGRCRQCRREDHRAYKRRRAVQQREREQWAASPYRRMRHRAAQVLREVRARIPLKRAALKRLQSELAALMEVKDA